MIAAALFALFCVLFFRWSNDSLQLTRWDAAFPDLPDGFDGCRIAVLSDLHGAEFGADGYDVVFDRLEKLKKEDSEEQ